MRAAQLAAVDIHTRRGVHCDNRDARDRLECRGRVGTQRRAATDADDPVDHHVEPSAPATTGLEGVEGAALATVTRPLHPPARLPERGDPLLVGAVRQQPRLDVRPPSREHRAGVQRIAAVGTRSDQQQHPASVAAAEQIQYGVREPVRCALHERALGELSQHVASAARTCSTVWARITDPR